MLPVVAFVLLALSGCTFVAPGAPAVEATKAPFSIDQADVVASLGTAPPWHEPSAERTDAMIQRGLDRQWQGVASSYPDVVRPEVAEIERAEGSNAQLTACLGAITSTGRENAIANYVCNAQYPIVPPNVLTEDQAGYLYDYWTGFYFPCVVENGFVFETAPPTRAAFVEEWPYQGWWPSPRYDEPVSDVDRAAFDARCPATLDVFG